MRVVVVPYPWEGDVVGGHVTQQVETVRALQRRGVEAEIVSIDEAVEPGADIVHAFEDVRPLLARGTPSGRLVVTPIYCPRSFVLGATPMYRRAGRRHMRSVQLRHLAHKARDPQARRARLADLRARDQAWRQADLMVVNSHAEARLLRRDVPGLRDVQVAYSGVAQDAFHGDPEEGRRLLGIGDEPFVLCVGRIEPRKNQVSLALAARDLPVKLVLVGSVLPGNEPYLEEVRTALRGLIHVPHIEHERLPHVHAAAAAHALASWYETTGLSTLEALAVGTPVVVARGPCVEEYFEGVAHFCDAADIGSIRSAIVRALEGPTGAETEHARRFSWERTAETLVGLYGP
ncbi:MAG TPA: glycosyltransferase [Gaiellaceae bacterium]|nr:glycosyltransferase [Gaiellaceae bacterium]